MNFFLFFPKYESDPTFFSFFFQKYECNPTFLFLFWNLCMFLKGVVYIRDGLLFRKLAFWVCLKTRCVTKRDALVLATLRY
jgi:hypothetical protein